MILDLHYMDNTTPSLPFFLVLILMVSLPLLLIYVDFFLSCLEVNYRHNVTWPSVPRCALAVSSAELLSHRIGPNTVVSVACLSLSSPLEGRSSSVCLSLSISDGSERHLCHDCPAAVSTSHSTGCVHAGLWWTLLSQDSKLTILRWAFGFCLFGGLVVLAMLLVAQSRAWASSTTASRYNVKSWAYSRVLHLSLPAASSCADMKMVNC